MDSVSTYTHQYIAVNGTRLHYLEWRSPGPPLVILHGNSHCGGVYAPLGDRLAPDFSVLAMDLRGHGLADKPDEYGWAFLRDDIIGMLEARDLHDVVFVSHSRGGGVSLLVAAACPDRVRGVVAYEPTVPIRIGQPQPPADWSRRLTDRALGRRATFPSRQGMYDHFRDRGAFAGWRDEFLRAFVEHGGVDRDDGTVELACPTRVEALLYQATYDVGAWEAVKPSSVPVLLVFGERGGRVGDGRDPVSPVRAMFPRCESIVLPGCTHSGPMEHPEVFEQVIRNFAALLP